MFNRMISIGVMLTLLSTALVTALTGTPTTGTVFITVVAAIGLVGEVIHYRNHASSNTSNASRQQK